MIELIINSPLPARRTLYTAMIRFKPAKPPQKPMPAKKAKKK